MAQQVGYRDVNHLVGSAIPDQIKFHSQLDLSGTKWSQIPLKGFGEQEALADLKKIAQKNQIMKNLIGMGYHDTITPSVIQRHILENPGWYTPYTPYQAEIAQGRMEMLFNFQTLIADLTGLTYANASLLDEPTACVEALMVSYHAKAGVRKHQKSQNKSQNKNKNKRYRYYVDSACHPQNIMVLQGRAERLNIELIIQDPALWNLSSHLDQVLGGLIQYPNTYGQIYNIYQLHELSQNMKKIKGLMTVACDPMSLVLMTPPSEFGADIALGNTQRFGVPLGGGGPHPAFFAVRQGLERLMPGRVIGLSGDAFRLTLQTREQHIKREKATSNICTAQALLANVASAYAIYHGPEGLGKIAQQINYKTKLLYIYLSTQKASGIEILNPHFFDTLHLKFSSAKHLSQVVTLLEENQYNARVIKTGEGEGENEECVELCVSLNETIDFDDVRYIASCITMGVQAIPDNDELMRQIGIPIDLFRDRPLLDFPVFKNYQTETEFMRYLFRLQKKDLGLNTSMIPLGSCTMKLNAVSEMMPLSWPEFSQVHPYAPLSQQQGFFEMSSRLKRWLAEATGFAAISLQPVSGALGEYTGLVVIANYLRSRGQEKDLDRNICLIPDSSHGTNPASARLAGFQVVVIKTDSEGNVDYQHLEKCIQEHRDHIACLMITYPSTFGVFEERIMDICQLVHSAGGQVYMDGANMNAQLGLTSPGLIGADVCHLNLHKTFCIPHGGGGPGMGPIGVASHLVDFLPAEIDYNTPQLFDDQLPITWPVSGSSHFGSGLILPISYQYISMMGQEGLMSSTKAAIVGANYMKHRLQDEYSILYQNDRGCVAHEFILDVRGELKRTGITAMDIAKRLQDYGFHGPTVSWPIANILMIEPTESESQAEMDRFCDALLKIKQEIDQIAFQINELEKIDDSAGIKILKESNILKNAPHTINCISDDDWPHDYSREEAIFPMEPKWRDYKHWPTVKRIDDLAGDRNLITSWAHLLPKKND